MKRSWSRTSLSYLLTSLLSTTADLFIYIDIPSEVRSEVLDLSADVLLHNGNQRDAELFQLGLQRGQLRGLLQIRRGRKTYRATRIWHYTLTLY